MSDSSGPLPIACAESPDRGRAVREWGIAALVSLTVALAVVSPFFFLGTASGHDVAFHMASWLDAASQWKQGVIFPRWAESANFGFGEPRFIFYPPLSWLFGAFLGAIFPWPAVAAVFNISVQMFAGLSAYALLRRLVDSRLATLFGAACFAANPYSLLIIYMRSDFAELLAMAFFPLLFLAILRISGDLPVEEQRTMPSIVAFAIPFCAIWLANAPAAVIATYSAALLLLLAVLRQRSIPVLARGAGGMLLGFGLSAFYLLPAIYEQRWVRISGALAGGLTPAENFLYAKTNDAEHDAFNRIASNIAVLLILWLLLAALAAWRARDVTAAGKFSRRFIAPTTTIAAAATLLMLPLTSILWRYLPELRFVQFPWRWMSILALGAVILTGASMRVWLRRAWLIAIPLTIGVSAHNMVKNAWWDTEDMPTLQAAMDHGTGFEGTDEYDPVGDDHTDLPQKEPRAVWLDPPGDPEAHRDARVVVAQWSAEHRVVRVATRKPGRLALGLLDYPAWRVTLNGTPVPVRHAKGTEQMILAIPAGESELRVDFTATMDRTIGGWISVASIAVCGGILFCKRREPRTARS